MQKNASNLTLEFLEVGLMRQHILGVVCNDINCYVGNLTDFLYRSERILKIG